MSAIVWKHIVTKLNEVVKGKVYFLNRPAKIKPPATVFNISRGEPVVSKESPTQDMVLVEIKYFDINKTDCVTNAEAIRTALEFYSGTEDGTTIKKCRCVGWEYPEVDEDERSLVVFEAIYTYEIRLKL